MSVNERPGPTMSFGYMNGPDPDLKAAIERVRGLHSPVDEGPGAWCAACGATHPCATIRALNPLKGNDYA